MTDHITEDKLREVPSQLDRTVLQQSVNYESNRLSPYKGATRNVTIEEFDKYGKNKKEKDDQNIIKPINAPNSDGRIRSRAIYSKKDIETVKVSNHREYMIFSEKYAQAEWIIEI